VDLAGALVADLRGPDPRRQVEAAKQLGRLRPTSRENLVALVEALSDRSPSVQEAAALALGQTGERAAVAPLAEVLAKGGSGPRTVVLRAAAEALGRFRKGQARAAAPALVATLRHPEAAVRLEAARTLGTIGESQAVPSLAEVALRDTDEGVRKAALQSIEALDPRALAELLAVPLIEKGDMALREGRLVSPPDDNALGYAAQARAAAPRSAQASRFHDRVADAIKAQVNELARADAQAAAALIDQAVAVDPSLSDLSRLKARLEEAARAEHARTHLFRVGHSHGLNIALDPNSRLGFGKGACVGTLELLEDGFRFTTEQTPDQRRDNVRFTFAQIRRIEFRRGGQGLRLETTEGKWEFLGPQESLEKIASHLKR
jgi:hypothetical protein